ncbi:MAG: CHASE2 domain-containing protein, partial [Thermoleophilia bacterium]|nr:CHASE2 domain-containing protein [Thermoleophilia bacterium]
MARTRYMPLRKARLAAIAFTVAACAAVVAFTAFTATPTGRALEYHSLDWRFATRGERPMPRDIVVVGIDNATDQAIGDRFPYRRSVYADAIDNLTAAGAAAIVLDIQFLESPDIPTAASDDGKLLNAIARSQKVVLATAPDGTNTTPLPFRGLKTTDGNDALAASGAVVGVVPQLVTSDGVIRWIRPREHTHSALGVPIDPSESCPRCITLPSLALAATAVATNTSPFEARGLPDKMMINWRGAAASYASTPTEQGNRVRLHNFAETTAKGVDLSWAHGAIVLIGATDPVSQDLHETPFQDKSAKSSRMPGVEIHAHAIATLADKSFIVSESPRAAGIMLPLLVVLRWAACTF